MKSITELVDVPEEEYSLYLQEHKYNGIAYGSDSARDANFRYETESRQEPKQNFFGKVKNPFPETNYLGAAARGFGRTLVNVVPDLARGLTRAWQEGITERLQKYSGQMDIARLDVEMRELEKRNNFDNMTVEQKRDFYKNNTEYNKLESQLDEAYDKMIMLESPEYKKQVDEIYGNLKKTQQQFVENIGLGAKQEDAKIITELAEGAGSLVEALGITFITKNPMAAGAVFGAQQGAGLYEELREKGVDVDKSLAIAGAGGLAEGALEYKGLDKLIENMTAKTFGKSVAKSFAIESIQEGSQQTAEEALMAKYRQDEEFKDKALRVGKSMLYGGVLGSAATVVSRPFLMRYANDVKDNLVQNGVDEQRANELTSDAVYGTPQEQEKASHEIQVAIGSSQFAQMGFSPDESEQLAETFALTQEEIQNEVLDSANAEIDPETYEGGTIAGGAKFFDENLKKDYIAEDFDIQEAVQEEAEKNHLPKEEAELAGKLVESFARVMYNKTGQTPKEFWESGGKLMIRDQRVGEMEDVDESELTQEEMDVADDGSYIGEDGLLHAKDGTVLFQSAYHGTGSLELEGGKFKVERIGTGEGHNAHGHGIYATASYSVADKKYREMIANALYGEQANFFKEDLLQEEYNKQEEKASKNKSQKEWDKLALLEDMLVKHEEMSVLESDEFPEDVKDWYNKNIRDKVINKERKQGNVFSLDIPENAYLINEQLKYENQPDVVKKAVDEIIKKAPENYPNKQKLLETYKDKTGAYLYLYIADIEYFRKHGTNKGVMAENSDAKKLASEKLNSLGVKGITYDGQEDGRSFVIFNPDDVKVIQKFYQGEKAQPRASYTQGAYEKIIDIFKTGDKSSIVHELGHYFTMNYIDVLTKYNQLDEVADVLNWLGVNSVDELKEEHWEKFARGFETYVMEGVSPNQKVASLFERFKQWLIQVYKDFVPEEINDDVRAFFDKMLASEEEFNYEEIMRLGNDMQSLREVMKNALAGKEVQIGGMNIADVKKLMNVLSTRIPRKPKTLVELFKDVGINEAFAKRFDLDALLGVKDLIQDEEVLKQLKKRGLITQKQINQARKLITKQGGISSEDEMIDFLSGLGLLTNVSDTYEGTSATWDEALNLIENAENIFRPQDIEQAEKREQILDAIEVAEKSLQGIGKYEDVVKAVKALAKEDIVGVQKETLKYIRNKQKELQKDYNNLLRKMLKAQKKDLQSVRDAVVDYIKGQPISGDDKVKLLGFIKKANSLNSLQKVSESIKNKAMEHYDNEQRKMLNKEIQRELKKTRPTSMTEQRYDYENNKLFVDLRNYNKLTKEKASEELAKLPMDEESISNLSEIDLIKRRFLSYKSRGADASSELMEQVLSDIVNAKEKGKQAKNEQEHEKMLKQEEDRQELLAILDEKNADPKSLSSKLQSIYRRGFTSLYSLLDSIFGKDVADKYQMEVKQTDVNSKIYFKSSEVIKNSARIFGVDGRNGLLNLFADMASKKYTITNSEGVNKEIDAFAIIDIYNAIKNEKTKNDYYSAFGEEQVNGLVNTLTVQQRAFGDYLMQEVNNYYEKLNKVYVKLYGIDLPRVDNYWMATSEHKDAIDIQGDYFQQTTIPSALKERARGRVVPIPKNAWEKFNKHIAEAEYISGLGLDYMNVKKIFKSNRVKGKIIEKYGEGIYKDIMNDIESLSMASKIQEIDAVTGLFQKILNNFVTAKIAIGIPVFVKQLTSCTNYAVDMPIAKWVSGFAEGLLHPRKTAKYMMANAPFLKARFGQGYNEAVERVIREAQKHSGKKVRWIEAMSSFTRLGDIGAIIYGGYPYLKYLKESGDKDAVQKFEFATLRSQQAGTPVSLSPFQRQRGMMRVFQAFNNTPTQYMRMLADAVYQYTNGDITAKKFAKQMFNFGLVQPILYVLAGTMAISMLGSGDDDDDVIMDIVRQILLNPIDAIPVFSDLAGALFDKMAGQKNYGLRPVLVQDIDKLMQKLNKDEYDAWDAADIITPIIEGISGAPAGRAVRILKTNFKD